MAHYDCKYCGRNGCLSGCDEALPLGKSRHEEAAKLGMKPAGNYIIQSEQPLKPWVPDFLSHILATLGRVKRFVIVDADGTPYLERITLQTRRDGSETMLHVIYKSDDDRGLHDHPWDFTSTLIYGAYKNHVFMPNAQLPADRLHTREYTAAGRQVGAPDLYQPHGCYRGPCQKSYILQRGVYHRLELVTSLAVTLVEHGPKLGDWGFWVDGKHVPHEQFISEKYGKRGEHQMGEALGDGTVRI